MRDAVEFNYLPWLERTYPHLARQYERLYHRNSPPAHYTQAVQARVRALKQKHGLQDRVPEMKARRPTPQAMATQLGLFTSSAHNHPAQDTS